MINNWNKLDNAAKIFPSATAGANTHVFRVSCTLKDDIDPAILQDALLETVERIPVYQYVMHRGIFWYYLEKTDLLPVIEEEHKPVCGGIYDPNVKKLLYEVTYYKRRINFEMYHVLGDGAGALNFLKTLVNSYISKKYKTV